MITNPPFSKNRFLAVFSENILFFRRHNLIKDIWHTICDKNGYIHFCRKRPPLSSCKNGFVPRKEFLLFSLKRLLFSKKWFHKNIFSISFAIKMVVFILVIKRPYLAKMIMHQTTLHLPHPKKKFFPWKKVIFIFIVILYLPLKNVSSEKGLILMV